ncbi:MAG TPA: hypothetical protein V6D48_20070 [Oculatellaceae cyanobacterium]
MSPLVPLVMWGWLPVVLYLFMRFPAQRAIVISFVVAWLFLPIAEFKLPGIPGYTKMSATCYGILLATIIYDSARLSTFQLGWIDLPMLIWCVCPFASSITNDLGPYDGFSATFLQVVTWGVPYFLGRIYLNNLNGLRLLAIGIFVGGLVYVPLCLYEIRLSPQLNVKIYGFVAGNGDFAQNIRYGGYRPTVFMEHGLAVGAWMMAATLCGIWLWHTGVIKKIWNIPVSWLVAVLLITFVLCKSTGAYVLLAIGLFILFAAKWLRTALPLLILIVALSSYLYVGMNGTFSGDQVVAGLSQVGFDQERVGSLKFRLDNEEILASKARLNPVFGWGGFGRNRVYDANGKDITVTDSLWIIAFGVNGAVGVVSLTASLLLPAWSFGAFRYPASLWASRKVGPAAVVAVAVSLYMLDCVMNAMINPIFVLASGAVAGVVMQETGTNQVTSTLSSGQRRSLPQQRQRQPN